MDRRFFLDDTTLGVLRIGFGGLLAKVHPLDDGTLLFSFDLQDFALLALCLLYTSDAADD